jgi:hypothetical protein
LDFKCFVRIWHGGGLLFPLLAADFLAQSGAADQPGGGEQPGGQNFMTAKFGGFARASSRKTAWVTSAASGSPTWRRAAEYTVAT